MRAVFVCREGFNLTSFEVDPATLTTESKGCRLIGENPFRYPLFHEIALSFSQYPWTPVSRPVLLLVKSPNKVLELLLASFHTARII